MTDLQKHNIQNSLYSFIGYMGQPEMKFFENGGNVTKFSIPLKKNKDDEPVWLNCEAFNVLGEAVAELQKGTRIFVQGTLKEEEYKGKTYTKLQILNYSVL